MEFTLVSKVKFKFDDNFDFENGDVMKGVDEGSLEIIPQEIEVLDENGDRVIYDENEYGEMIKEFMRVLKGEA